MADISTSLQWNGELKFTGRNAQGFETNFDGNTQTSSSPMEILLESVGSCSAIDVVLILQKMREPVTALEVTLDGDRQAVEPRYFHTIHARFDLWGELSAEKVERAINLSFSKYCSVFHSLRTDLKLFASYRLHAENTEASGEYVSLTITLPPG
jgi:putative redox protein